jgi:hypothetical protein
LQGFEGVRKAKGEKRISSLRGSHCLSRLGRNDGVFLIQKQKPQILRLALRASLRMTFQWWFSLRGALDGIWVLMGSWVFEGWRTSKPI